MKEREKTDMHGIYKLLSIFLGCCFISISFWGVLALSDPGRATCGKWLPLAVYRFTDFFEPLLNFVLKLLCAAFVVLLGARVAFPKHEAIKSSLWWVLVLLLVCTAIKLGPSVTPTSYPECEIHRPAASSQLAKTSGKHLTNLQMLKDEDAAIDVMTVAVKPTCINEFAIQSLVTHLAPRRIFVVTRHEFCSAFEAYHPSVRCLREDHVVQGMSMSSLRSYLEKRYAAAPERVSASSLKRGGWYLQQFAKLLFWTLVPDLSPVFVIWDSDMVMTDKFHVYNSQGLIRQHVGGVYAQAYATTFHRLSNKRMLYGERWHSFVVHHLIVYKPCLEEMLAATGFSSDDGIAWVYKVLDAVEDQDLHQGFSEYASYIAWVLAQAPDILELQPSKQWERYAPKSAMPKRNAANCCPQRKQIDKLMDTTDFEYFGYELGHLEFCHYDDPKYALHYP